MSLIEDLASDGIPATVEPLPNGLWRAALHHRDGELFIEHIACPDQAAAEAWLFANVKDVHPNCYAVRAAPAGRAA